MVIKAIDFMALDSWRVASDICTKLSLWAYAGQLKIYELERYEYPISGRLNTV